MTDRVPTAVDQYLSSDDRILVSECEVDHYRSRGPGGQKRNKTSSAVRLRHRPTGLAVIATEDRSQHVNKRRALRRLREAIALNVRTDLDVAAYQPSPLLSSCVQLDGRLFLGRKDSRYYLVVCEILDILAACGCRVREAAECFGISTAHLVKFIENDPKLWKQVNQMRTSEGIKPLRPRNRPAAKGNLQTPE